jgi:hypothetical protein
LKRCSHFCLYTGDKIYKNTVISRLFKLSIRPFEKNFNHGRSSTDHLCPPTYSSTCWERELCVNQAFAIYQSESNRESRFLKFCIQDMI